MKTPSEQFMAQVTEDDYLAALERIRLHVSTTDDENLVMAWNHRRQTYARPNYYEAVKRVAAYVEAMV